MRADISAVLGGTRREIVYDLRWDDYRSAIGLNPSTIGAGLKSQLELKHTWDCDKPDTDAMLWGRALHCLLLEPRQFATRYAYWDGRRAGNDYKDFAATCWEKGVEVLTKAAWDSVQKAALRFVHEPIVQDRIRAGKAEVTLFEREFDIQCRGRVDWISTSCHTLVDVKTTASVESRAFGRTFKRFAYGLKLGLYQRWLDRLTGDHWPVECLCIEQKPPHDITVVPIPDAVLEQGVRRGLEIIRKTQACIKANVWPGIAGGDLYPLDTCAVDMDDELELDEEEMDESDQEDRG